MFQILYESTYFWPYGETHTWCFIQPSLFQKLQLKAVFAHWGHLHLLSSSCSSSPSSSSCWPPDVLVPSSWLTSRPFSHRMGGWYYSEVHNAIYTQTANDTMQSMLSYRKKKKKKDRLPVKFQEEQRVFLRTGPQWLRAESHWFITCFFPCESVV